MTRGFFARLWGGARTPSDAADACPVGAYAPGWTRPDPKRIATVGWVLDTPRAKFIWDSPRRIVRDDPAPTHAKSVNYCPAVVDQDARMWDVPCPIDLRLRFKRDADGRPGLVNLDGDRASVRPKHFSQMVAMVGEKEWRHPERPIIQIITPYVFLADEPVWMSQIPPITNFRADPWPGLVIGGRLPIHIWPRHMMWAFEWWDVSKDLALVRGEPWFHLRFETNDPARHVRVVEAELTPELREYMAGISSVANYVGRTFSLFKTAQERRPDKLLVRNSGRESARNFAQPDER